MPRRLKQSSPSSTPLERRRIAHGLTQEQLAQRVHMTKSAISKLELGQRQMTKEKATRLAGVLECHWLELMDEAPALSQRETALVELYRALEEPQKEALFKVVDAMAQPKVSKDGTDD